MLTLWFTDVILLSFLDVLFDCNVPLTPDEIRIVGRKHEVGNTGRYVVRTQIAG